MSGYVELHCHTCYSLLDGASRPEALLDRAQALGMSALAITDNNALYGAVEFWSAAQERGLHAVIGAEVHLADDDQGEGGRLVLLAENREGYANLCRLISAAQLAGAKGNARLTLEQLTPHTGGLIVLTGGYRGRVNRLLLAGQSHEAAAWLRTLQRLAPPGNLYVELQHHLHRHDHLLLPDLAELAAALGLPVVATNGVHYAERWQHRLYDLLLAIDRNLTLDEARPHLLPNSEYYLKGPEEMAALLGAYPEALANTERIAARCRVDLNLRSDALPPTPHDGEAPAAQLERLCREALPRLYPHERGATERQLAHELQVIAQTRLAGYFITVWDIVRYAREQGIQVRGRGSAANSIVAYLLGITNVDPLANDLLFERFLSAESRVMPDIDLDFNASRREEVLQYVYAKYGEDHVGMVCNYVTYRQRSAVRDVGKALGFPPDLIDHLAKAQGGLGSYHHGDVGHPLMAHVSGETWGQFLALYEQIQGLPRHLSIHVGGMVITRRPLVELVPLERATMPGRVVVQWNKDSLEEAGLIKFDLLSLGTFGVLDECLATIERRHGRRIDLDRLPLDDPRLYAILQRADTVGLFQVESRAQQQALVKMRPRTFNDIVIEVAIIRPGPLLGNMVHPFFRRRMGQEPVTYLHPLLEPILQETLGVIVFQEQVIRIAMAMGRFTPGEADLLRRAMSHQRSHERMAALQQQFVQGALSQGVSLEVAEQVFAQLSGFAAYGFCKSHAASFAKTTYDTLYLRAYYPAEYYCALLNNQPMGFYAPRVLVRDALRHQVKVRPVDVNRSDYDCTLEGDAIRLGLRYVDGLGEVQAERILAARAQGAFGSLADFCRRTRLPRRLIEQVIMARGFEAWGVEPRRLVWELGRLRYQADELPLPLPPDGVELAAMDEAERLLQEYGATGVAADGHLLELYRASLDRQGVLSSPMLTAARQGATVRVAGMVITRQAPPTAKGFVFLTLEDEWGLINVIIRPDVFQGQRVVWRNSLVLLVQGQVQHANGYCNIQAEKGWVLR
ncbi:MAG: DNA polymerase III subunit alpha [Anaerolineae bacterium]|jgi:error-prone DNA polymerase